MKLIKVTFVFFLITSSCTNNVLVDEYKAFENSNWNTDSIVRFTFDPPDSIEYKKINIKIRHNTNYEYQNLFLFVYTNVLDTLEIRLANKEGKWLGKGLGDVRELNIAYREDFIFPNNKPMTFRFEQAMRYGDRSKLKDLKNILALGISIKDNE